jgi:hypothetical protein
VIGSSLGLAVSMRSVIMALLLLHPNACGVPVLAAGAVPRAVLR